MTCRIWSELSWKAVITSKQQFCFDAGGTSSIDIKTLICECPILQSPLSSPQITAAGLKAKKKSNFEFSVIVTSSFLEIVLTFHEHFKIKCKSFCQTLYCIVALLHLCIATLHITEGGKHLWNVEPSLLFTLSTLLWNLFWTCDFTLSFAHTDTLNTHSLITASLIQSTSKRKTPETVTSVRSGCFVYSPRMWLLSVRAAVLPTQNWAAAPACRRLTAEVKWEEVTQCSV